MASCPSPFELIQTSDSASGDPNSSSCSSVGSGSRGEIDDTDNCNITSEISTVYTPINLENFSIIDSTLREGEQFATAHFDTTQKLEIARALDEFGVDYVEPTSPAASPQSRADCEAICKMGLRAKVLDESTPLILTTSAILCHIRCNMDDAKIAVQTGVNGVNVCIGTSSKLMEHSHGKNMAFITAKAKEVIE
ncbi:homocitrate synthase- mitochondrial precursor [Apiospora arundinis]